MTIQQDSGRLENGRLELMRNTAKFLKIPSISIQNTCHFIADEFIEIKILRTDA